MTLLQRSLFLNLILAVGLGAVFVLPRSFGVKESAVVASFPTRVGEWIGEAAETPEVVVGTLAKDTGHSRASYSRIISNGGQQMRQHVDAFMVISGADMNASIHRPERCFPAQGLSIQERKQFELEVGDGRKLPVTMLDAEALITKGDLKGKTYRQRAYYWFVGHSDTTNSHWKRTLVDMRDRVFKGYNQRWAYVMLSSNYGLEGTNGLDGEVIGAVIEDLAKELFTELHKTEQLSN